MDGRYFVESQAEASECDSDDTEEITAAEWDEAMRQAGLEQHSAEESRESSEGADPPSPMVADRMVVAPRPRVERSHVGLGSLAAAAAAASPLGDQGEVPLYPQGLADVPENDKKETTRVVFTINNPGIERPVFDPTKMAYLVWQLESGANGTLHVQGYCRFVKKFRLRTLHDWISPRAAVLIARGNEQQCRDYCTKEDTRVEVGEEHGVFDANAGKKGHRYDLDAIAAKCAAGVPLRQIVAEHPTEWIRHAQGIADLHERLAPEPPVFRTVTVQVLWGPSHTGKTHRILTNSELRRTGGIYVVKPGRGPWDRYQGQKTVLFDEFNWKKWEVYEMNQFLDKWTTSLDCRFHDKFAVWTHVVICANSSPATWYVDSDMEVQLAFRRRLGHACRHVVHVEQDLLRSLPEPDFDPEDGRDVLLMHQRGRVLSSSTSEAVTVQVQAGAPLPPAAAAAMRPLDYYQQPISQVLCPDSRPPSDATQYVQD